MNDEELLAEMRRQYRYATLKDHMLVSGVIRARCAICMVRPVPDSWSHVRWCDECMTECEETCEGIDAFVARKRAERERV